VDQVGEALLLEGRGVVGTFSLGILLWWVMDRLVLFLMGMLAMFLMGWLVRFFSDGTV
jgi:hypothetical protein